MRKIHNKGHIVSIIFFLFAVLVDNDQVGSCVMLLVRIIPDLWSTLICELYENSVLFFLFCTIDGDMFQIKQF